MARSYKIFTETMRAHRQNVEDPHARLLAICEGYLDFARQHTALFQFMFQPFTAERAQVNASVMAELETHSGAAFHELAEACAPFEPVAGQAGGSEALVWSLVHGYAMLFASAPEGATPIGTLPDFAQILPVFPLRK